MQDTRARGDRIPGELIKQLRSREKITQAEMAARLGVKGGKAVISQWERVGCDGPAAELILLLFGGAADRARMAEILRATDAEWGSAYPTWYQVSAALHGAAQLPARDFAEMFPDAALPDEQRRFGFPFVEGLPVVATRIGTSGWVGRIPVEADRAAAYYWRFTRDCKFVSREKAWEVDQLSSTQGHVHVGSLLEQAVCLVYFIRRLSARLDLASDRDWSLGLHVGGARGRGVVHTQHADSNGMILAVPPPSRVSPDDRFGATIEATVDQIASSSVSVAYDLVAETVMPLRPDLARAKVLREQLQLRHRMDMNIRGNDRHLVFLDGVEL